jgi:hypothetical protein
MKVPIVCMLVVFATMTYAKGTCEITQWEQRTLDRLNEWRASISNPKAANMQRV